VVYSSGTIPNVSNPTVGDIYTVAGNGTSGYSGDGGAATSAKLDLNTNTNISVGVAVDASGNIYIADIGNNRIREVAASTGKIATVAGNGSSGYSGDKGPAINAKISQPEALALDLSGNIYIADTGNSRVRLVYSSGTIPNVSNPTVGDIYTVAGNGTMTVGNVNNSIPATSAEFVQVSGVAVDVLGNIYIADAGNGNGDAYANIYQVLATTGIINTVAGEDSDATCTGIDSPIKPPDSLAVDSSGNIYFNGLATYSDGTVLAIGSLLTRSVLYPAYEVTSILYAPPGNASQAGYTDTTTTATTTTVGSSFANASTLTFTEGISVFGVGGSASQSFGISESSSNSTAFQESFSDATGVANQNKTGIDAINHNQDTFLIWLNPQVSVVLKDVLPAGLIPGAYSVSVQESVYPDIVPITAAVMEANSSGVTTVPAGWLNQQNFPSGPEPGLAAICKNLIQAEYKAGTCTLADQCGCTPADFAPILAMDPLLFYNGTTNPISPFPGTVSPLVANTSTANFSDANCGILPTPPLDKSSCRYVSVPSSPGGSLQADPWLAGPESVNGNQNPDSFQQGENQQTTQTSGETTGESVGVSFKEGAPVFSLTEADTMTWTQSQSVGTANGSGTTQSVTLNSSTQGCAENEAIFEDTVYHTFVFQEFPDPGSKCTQNSPSFSITATNPSQTTSLSLGHSMTYTVNVSASFGFSGTVTLSASGLPAGVTASFSPSSVTTSSSGSATLTLTSAYSASTFIGNSTITITGTSGSLNNSTAFSLTTQPLQYRGYCGIQ
jgi:hypothetical protein